MASGGSDLTLANRRTTSTSSTKLRTIRSVFEDTFVPKDRRDEGTKKKNCLGRCYNYRGGEKESPSFKRPAG